MIYFVILHKSKYKVLVYSTGQSAHGLPKKITFMKLCPAIQEASVGTNTLPPPAFQVPEISSLCELK